MTCKPNFTRFKRKSSIKEKHQFMWFINGLIQRVSPKNLACMHVIFEAITARLEFVTALTIVSLLWNLSIFSMRWTCTGKLKKKKKEERNHEIKSFTNSLLLKTWSWFSLKVLVLICYLTLYQEQKTVRLKKYMTR